MGVDEEVVHHLEPLSAADSAGLFVARARESRTRPRGRRGHRRRWSTRSAAPSTDCHWPSSSPPPGCAPCPSRDIARRLDDRFALLQDPSSRRPERTARARGRHRLELRPALPRRPARAVGALVLRRQRVARRGRARAGRPRGACRGSGRHADPAGRPLAGQRRRRPGRPGPLPAARQHRAYAGERLVRRRTGRDRSSRARAAGTAGLRSGARHHIRGKTSRLPRPSPAPSVRTSTPRSRGATSNEPDLGVAIATGFGWTWVVLGDGPAAAAGSAAPCRQHAHPASGPGPGASPAGSRRLPATSRWRRATATLAAWLPSWTPTRRAEGPGGHVARHLRLPAPAAGPAPGGAGQGPRRA